MFIVWFSHLLVLFGRVVGLELGDVLLFVTSEFACPQFLFWMWFDCLHCFLGKRVWIINVYFIIFSFFLLVYLYNFSLTICFFFFFWIFHGDLNVVYTVIFFSFHVYDSSVKRGCEWRCVEIGLFSQLQSRWDVTLFWLWFIVLWLGGRIINNKTIHSYCCTFFNYLSLLHCTCGRIV